ncbi:MAG: hypothetical protein HXY34_03425 [Candidatus Thorarchaeota archaeon]|nr:hypothetical protein [Candidatus Thorarchaeota archaeon]
MTSEKKFTGTVREDPNFLWILAGAAVWLIGYYTILIGPLLVAAGFALTCYMSAVGSARRPVDSGWSGLAVGVLLVAIGVYVAPLWWLAPFFNVAGGTMTVFYASALGLQKGVKGFEEMARKASDRVAGDRKTARTGLGSDEPQ